MTRKISISVPDDIGKYLDEHDNASAVVAAAVRTQMRVERLRAFHAEHGIIVTEEGRARARLRLAQGQLRIAARKAAEEQDRAAQQADATVDA